MPLTLKFSPFLTQINGICISGFDVEDCLVYAFLKLDPYLGQLFAQHLPYGWEEPLIREGNFFMPFQYLLRDLHLPRTYPVPCSSPVVYFEFLLKHIFELKVPVDIAEQRDLLKYCESRKADNAIPWNL